MQHTKVMDGMYNTRIDVVIFKDIRGIPKKLKVTTDTSTWPDTVRGACFPTKKGVVIWMKGFSWDTFTHEAFHATYAILTAAGVKLCDKSEEAFAYYLGWLVSEYTRKIETKVTKEELPC